MKEREEEQGRCEGEGQYSVKGDAKKKTYSFAVSLKEGVVLLDHSFTVLRRAMNLATCVARKPSESETSHGPSQKFPVEPTVVRLELHCALQESLAVLLDSLASNICSSSREKEVSARPRLPVRRTNHSQQNSEIAELSTLNASSSNFLSSYSHTQRVGKDVQLQGGSGSLLDLAADLEHQHAKGDEVGFRSGV